MKAATITIIAFLFISQAALADILSPWRYIKRYQLGVSVGNTNDQVNFNFDSDPNTYTDPDFCKEDETDPTVHNCSIDFNQSSSNFAIFLEQPFKRRGFWHIDWDISIGLQGFSGEFKREEDDPNLIRNPQIPIDDVNVSYYGIGTRIYMTVGVTPRKWPEVLLSFGPTGEAMFGKASFNGETYSANAAVRRSSIGSIFSFASLDIVFFRFKKGYFGLVHWWHNGDNDVQEGELVPNDLDSLKNLNLTFRRNFIGFKLLLK